MVTLEKGHMNTCRTYINTGDVAQLIKNQPAMWETWVQSLGWEDPLEEDPLEKERLPTPEFWPGEFHGLYSPWSCKELDTTERLSFHFKVSLELEENTAKINILKSGTNLQ